MRRDYVWTHPDENGKVYGIILPDETIYRSDRDPSTIILSIPVSDDKTRGLYLRRFGQGVIATLRQIEDRKGNATGARTWTSKIRFVETSYDEERRRVLAIARKLSHTYPEARYLQCTYT